MDSIIDTLARLIENPTAFGGKQPETPRQILSDLSGAPESVRRLAHAMATRYFRVNLGAFSMFESGSSGVVASLDESLELSAERAGVDLSSVLPQGFVPAQTLELAPDGGGMSVLGLAWAGGEASFVLVELDDPTEDNLVQRFATPAELLDLLDEKARGRALPDLDALRAAIG